MDQPKRPVRGATVIDVAKRAGVSAMTVSRVINGATNVRDEKRRAVEEAVQALHYTPNVAARSLVTSREVRIGVIYSHPSAAFMSDFLTGVFEEASAKGAQLVLLKGEDGGPPSRAAIERLGETGARGVILAPPLGESRAVHTILQDAGLFMAVVGGGAPGAISVRIDDRRGAHDMTRHLIELGHRRIGFVIGNPDQSASADRLAGFHDAVREHGGIDVQVVQGDFSFRSGLLAGEQLLDSPHRPTAIFASNDDMAAAIVSVAHRRHLDVPGDLSVVGFDDTTPAVMLWPPLTTIRQPVRQLAAEALGLLMRRLQSGNNAERPDNTKVLPHLLVVRESAAPPGRAKE